MRFAEVSWLSTVEGLVRGCGFEIFGTSLRKIDRKNAFRMKGLAIHVWLP